MKKLMLSLGILSAVAICSQAADVKELWSENCAKCHGANGNGDTRMGKKLGVKDLTNPKVQEALTDQQAMKSIKEGVTVEGKEKMKAYGDKLSEQQIKDLVAHIRTFKK